MWKCVRRLIELISSALAKIAMGCIFAMVSVIGVDVFCRYVLNSPLLWSDEMSSFLLVALAFLGASRTLREGKHIKVEVITMRLNTGVQLRIKLVTSIISTIILSIFSLHCAVMVYNSYIRGVTTPSVLLSPLWIPQMVMLIGAIFLTLQMLVETGEAIKNFRGK